LLAKLETLGTSLSSKDREIAMLSSKLESHSEDNDKRKKYLDDAKNELSIERAKWNEKIEQLR